MNQPAISLRNAWITYTTRTGLLSSRKHSALKDINLDIIKGETLGVMGANGSGKSTLLKLLSRIYQPDAGSIKFSVNRVSLMALSVGFDLNLSGSDNAYLSSMLLGASRSEARQKLPAIIEFSELGPYANNPLRTYSSGMRSRLGFSIALQMHADVMLIDEALAVGDAHFKEKSENAINQKLASDQTVVLVSHSTEQIVALCDRAIWLNDGRLVSEGDPVKVAAEYKQFISNLD